MLKFNKLGKSLTLTLLVGALFVVGCRLIAARAKEGHQHTGFAQMKVYCDELDFYTTGNLLGRNFLQDAPQNAWRERKTQRDEPKTPFREATVWFRNGFPVVASIFPEPRNHQRVTLLKLYFRVDGTIVKSDFVIIGTKANHTFIEQLKYFDGKGKQVFTGTKGVDIKTLKRNPINLSAFKIPEYRTIKELPFFQLLGVKGGHDSKPQPKG